MKALIFIILGIFLVAGIALMPLYKEIQKDKKNPPKIDKSKIKPWEDDDDDSSSF
jgi:uncharacterized protein YxeA